MKKIWDFFEQPKMVWAYGTAKPAAEKPTSPPPLPGGTPDDDEGDAGGGAGVQGITPDRERDREPSRAARLERPAERAQMTQVPTPPRTFEYSMAIKVSSPDYPVQGNSQARTLAPEPLREHTPEVTQRNTVERSAAQDKTGTQRGSSQQQDYDLKLALELTRAKTYRSSGDPERQQEFSVTFPLRPEDSQFVNKVARAPNDLMDRQYEAERDTARAARLARYQGIDPWEKEMRQIQERARLTVSPEPDHSKGRELGTDHSQGRERTPPRTHGYSR